MEFQGHPPTAPPASCTQGLRSRHGQAVVALNLNSPPDLESFPGGSDGKAAACNAGDQGLIPTSGSYPRGGHGNPLQCSCLENPHGLRSLGAAVHRVTNNRIRLSDFSFSFQT